MVLAMDQISYLAKQLEVEYITSNRKETIPVDAASKAWIWGRSLAGIACSNPAGGMDVCFLWLLCMFSGRGPTEFNLLNPTGYVMHQQFNIQQLYVLPTLYLCVLYLSENKQRLVPLTS